MPRSLNSKPHQKLRRLLREARLSAGFTQAEIAGRIKHPQSYVSKYESGERQLDVIEFVEVCQALGLPPSQLIAALEQ